MVKTGEPKKKAEIGDSHFPLNGSTGTGNMELPWVDLLEHIGEQGLDFEIIYNDVAIV